MDTKIKNKLEEFLSTDSFVVNFTKEIVVKELCKLETDQLEVSYVESSNELAEIVIIFKGHNTPLTFTAKDKDFAEKRDTVMKFEKISKNPIPQNLIDIVNEIYRIVSSES